ncbi:MAG: 4a-hydroxytetrahydrobiopterin dehydratase [Acidobacteria bacterium]|nr:MAG: 4a-hydroxytetrahydrobiopterin dehydratase [Acidobacteriota bacterium]
MPSALAEKHCAPVPAGTAPLRGDALRRLAAETPKWEVISEHELRRKFAFPDFASALQFVNAIGAIAEREQHHPDISLGWGKAAVTTWTHSVNGLSENDFILAAQIDRLPQAS